MIVLKLLDGSYLHDVRDNDRQVIGYISDAKNAVGTLDFDIYPKHPAYNAIKAGSTKIRAYRDGMWMHDYTVESVTNDLQLKKHVTATDELQYLERIEVQSYKTGVDGVPQTVSGFFMWLVEYYNARSGGERFAFGQIEGDIIDPTTTLDRSSDSPATVASIVKDKIIDSLGGYVRVRRDNGVLTIDLKADAAGVCHQYIEFGENLVDYADEQDASELYTAITADSTYKDDAGDEVTITLADAPDGGYLTGYVKQGDTVTNTVAAAAYGVRRKHLTFDGIKSVYTLVENCEKYIAAHCEPVTTVNVSAADLSTLDSNVQSFDVGLYTRVKAAPMGFDAAFECQSAKRSLNDPTDDTYTLGWTWGSLSSINNRKSVETALGIGRLEQASAEIDQTAKDAAQQAQTAQDVANAANTNAIDAVTKADSATAEATSASDTAQRAEAISAEAKQTATEAHGVAQDASETASTAASTAAQASATATEAKSTATQTAGIASEAQKRADAAKTAAESAAAEAIDAKAAAADADAKATLAQTSATVAKSAADAANEAAGVSGAAANAAQEAAGAAQATADAAATKAGQVAAETAAVKRELAGVKQDALDLGTDLNGKIDSVTSTMTADYAKKTELSTTEASLKSEITKSAAEIQQTVSETYAKTTDVEGNIATAKADLQTQITQNAGLISSTATAVESAQADATAAQAKANSASTAAEAAQSTANTAKSNAATAQSTANTAKTNAATAQSAANKAQADATAAATAASAASTAAERAKTDAIAAAGAYADSVAETLQGQIDGAIETWSGTVAPTATNAPAKDWTTADARAKHVGDLYYDTETGYAYRYSTTYIWTLIKDTDVTKAIADAAAAQSAADAAKASASTAQSTANTAKTNAATAQTAANNAQSTANTAKTNAANAQASADAAQAAADGAQADVDALGTRVTTAETAITQSAEQIALKANKTDVYAKGDTYSKTQADAAIKVSADNITSTVSKTYATQTSLATTDTKATNAASAASTAQSTADTAKANASTAQTGVNGLTTRMTAAESSITQQADSIALRATKTEVATAKSEAVSAAATDATAKADNALAGAKTYADAQIKVQADRITANVAVTDGLGTRMSTVEQTASGLSVSLSNTNTAVATAQSTANTARTEAAAAAKTASNYMEYTSAGLDVGNKSSGAWSGLRSRMASGAFQVLNSAGTVLSSFGADLIEIGKNSINSVIKLCGGKGSIAYYADTDQLAIMAPGSIAMTACQTLPDGTVQPYDAGIACNRYGVLAKGAVEVSGTLSINNKPVVDYVTSRSASGNLVTETYASGKKMISTSSPISFANGLGRVAVSNNVVSVYIASYGSMTVTSSGTAFEGVIPAVLRPQVDVVAAGTALGNSLAQIKAGTAGYIGVYNWANSSYWAGSLSYVINT